MEGLNIALFKNKLQTTKEILALFVFYPSYHIELAKICSRTKRGQMFCLGVAVTQRKVNDYSFPP